MGNWTVKGSVTVFSWSPNRHSTDYE